MLASPHFCLNTQHGFAYLHDIGKEGDHVHAEYVGAEDVGIANALLLRCILQAPFGGCSTSVTLRSRRWDPSVIGKVRFVQSTSHARQTLHN